MISANGKPLCFIFSYTQDFDISLVCLIPCRRAKSSFPKTNKENPKGGSMDFFGSLRIGAEVCVCVCVVTAGCAV